MRAMAWLLLALMIPAGAVAQVRGGDPDRRAELEQQIRRHFLAQLGRRLDLSEEQRQRVREVLVDAADARADLAAESHALRADLLQAVRDEETPMSEYETLLERLEAIRARERELAQEEEAALAEFLDPRQRAVFLMLRMEFNQRLRQMRGRGPGMGHPGGPGGASPFL